MNFGGDVVLRVQKPGFKAGLCEFRPALHLESGPWKNVQA